MVGGDEIWNDGGEDGDGSDEDEWVGFISPVKKKN